MEDLRARRHRDWMHLLVLWVVEQRSAGNVLRKAIAQSPRVETAAAERMRKIQVGLESSYVVEVAVEEAQRTLRDFGMARRMFGRDLKLRLQPVGLERHLRVEESFLDVGSFPGLLEQQDYMIMAQSWKLPDFEVLLRLVDLRRQ